MELVKGLLKLLVLQQHNGDLSAGLNNSLVVGRVHLFVDGLDLLQADLIGLNVSELLLVASESLVQLRYELRLLVVELDEKLDGLVLNLFGFPVILLQRKDLRFFDVSHGAVLTSLTELVRSDVNDLVDGSHRRCVILELRVTVRNQHQSSRAVIYRRPWAYIRSNCWNLPEFPGPY